MKIAMVTDIHENFANLEKAMKAINQLACDMVVCLGDITGYSPLFYNHQPDANACIDLLRQRADVVVAGNHDLFTAGRLPSYHLDKDIPENWFDLTLTERIKISRNKIWLYMDEIVPKLSAENAAFLARLKEWEILEENGSKILFTHFFKPDMVGVSRWFPFNSLGIKEHFRFMRKHKCSLGFTGHRHPAAPVRINRLFWSDPDDEPIPVKSYHKAFICPAITDGRFPGSFITFDTRKQLIETHPVF